MKTSFQSTIRRPLFCLSVIVTVLLQQCVYGQGQSARSGVPVAVQAMVKNQPFPYPTGVAMDSALYANVKAKLQVADALRTASKRAVDSLQKVILKTRESIDALARLGRHDAGKASALLVLMNQVQHQLTLAQSDLRRAEEARLAILKPLPRRMRKQLDTASPEQVAQAVAGYVLTLQKRQWTFGAVGTGIGFLFTLALLL